jgi:hypothetical protein
MATSRSIEWFWWAYSDLPAYAHRTNEYVIAIRVNGGQWRETLVQREDPPTAGIIPAIASLFEAGLLPDRDPYIDHNEAFYGPIRRH